MKKSVKEALSRAMGERKSPLAWFLDLLYPPKCPFCTAILDEGEEELCARCQTSLPWLEEEERIALLGEGLPCAGALAYRDAVREAIHRYKFHGKSAYAPLFGKLMAQSVSHSLNSPWDLVTWAPLSKKRMRERGYDQAELLARAMASELGLPCMALLRKTRHTKPQSSLNGRDLRMANAEGAYEVVSPFPAAGLRVLVADDVVTSGATLSQCAKVLLAAGAGEVGAAVLARAF